MLYLMEECEGLVSEAYLHDSVERKDILTLNSVQQEVKNISETLEPSGKKNTKQEKISTRASLSPPATYIRFR